MINVNLCMVKQHYDFLKPYIIHFSFSQNHITVSTLLIVAKDARKLFVKLLFHEIVVSVCNV